MFVFHVLYIYVLWWLICAIRVFAPRPRHFHVLIIKFSLRRVAGKNMLISGEGRVVRKEVLLIKLRPALSLKSVFSSHDPAV
jgi:hypothetical protein